MEDRELILCTGGLGYVGSHCAISLYESGYRPILIDNLANSNMKCLERLEKILDTKIDYFEKDIRIKEELREVFMGVKEKYGKPVHGVIHFAGLKAVGISVSDPLGYFESNVGGSVNLMQVMREFGVKLLVFSSSACVYGDTNNFEEGGPIHPTNPYGETKAVVEKAMSWYAASDPHFVGIALRYFNPIGAHRSGTIGESPNDIPNNLMPIVLNVALGKKESLSIFGNDYPTPDGSGIRDYVHVADISDAHVLALKNKHKMKPFEIINLGTSRGFSVFEVIKAFEEANEVKLNTKIEARRPGDEAISIAANSKAKELLGWEPKRTLEQACKDAWNWATKNPDGYMTV